LCVSEPAGILTPGTSNSLPEGRLFLDVPEGIRTPDRALRRRMLYPAELPGHMRKTEKQAKFMLSYIDSFYNLFFLKLIKGMLYSTSGLAQERD